MCIYIYLNMYIYIYIFKYVYIYIAVLYVYIYIFINTSSKSSNYSLHFNTIAHIIVIIFLWQQPLKTARFPDRLPEDGVEFPVDQGDLGIAGLGVHPAADPGSKSGLGIK